MRPLLCALLVALSACGVASPTIEELDLPADGEVLFNARVLAHRPGCVTCHSLEPGRQIVGPSLAEVGARAAQRVGGVDAVAYLRQSIVDTDAYVVEGFRSGVMPNDFVTILNDDQIAALVEFLGEQ